MSCASRATIIVVIVLGASVASFSQSFAPPVQYVVGSHPYAVAVGDFNGDGKLDLAAANNTSKTVSVLLGNGDTTFNARTDYDVGAGPYGIVTVDLNQDGKLDIATINSYGQTTNVSVLLGNGNGTFQNKVDYACTGSLVSNRILAADLNGDNKPDLVSVNDKGATVFLGNGDGTLKSPVVYGSTTFASSLEVADFNADNKLDLAVSSYGASASGLVSIMLGSGDGTFMTPVNYAAGPGPFAIAAFDFNGDTKADLVTVNLQSDSISVLLGNGDGTFQPKVNYPAGSSLFGLGVADFNGDGKLDVLVAGNGFGLYALKGNGDGTFRAPDTFTTGGVFATVVDLNADGKPDVITGWQGNSIEVLLNQTGPYSLAGLIKDSNGMAMSAVSVFLTGGADRRTITDLAGAYSFSDLAVAGSYTVAPSKQNYTFAPPNQSFNNLSASVTADFTGTLSTYSISGRVRDNFGNSMNNVLVSLTGALAATTTTLADGTYSFTNLPGGGNYTLSCSYPKFSFNDFPISNLSSNRTVNFSGRLATFTISGVVSDVNNGSSLNGLWVTLTGSRTGAAGTNSIGYSFTNLPIDGTYTVTAYAASGNTLFTNYLVSSPTSQTFNGLSANMTANFGVRQLFYLLTGLDPEGVAAGDLNGDGKIDLAVASVNGGLTHVLIGNGDGTFNTPVFYPTQGNRDVVMADFNRDGKLDVASAGTGVNIFIGNGDGTLKAAVNYPIATGSAASVMCVVDLNGDSKLDLAVLSSGNNLNILMGNGDGTLAAATTRNIPTAVGSVSNGDFNADGKSDLILMSFPNSIMFLAGNGDGTFANPVTFAAGNDVRKGPVADFNADGKLDVGGANFRAFTILLGNGNGTFQSPISNTLMVDTAVIVTGDFDGDSKLDVAIGGPSGGMLFSAGNGDGTFGPTTGYGAGTFTTGLVPGDFNGDGKQDVAVSSHTGSGVFVLINTSLNRLPSMQFSAATLSVNEDAGNATVRVTRTTGVSGSSTVNYVTSDQAGTQNCATANQKASARCDYSAIVGTLEFAAGETSKTISVPIVDDSYLEGNESFTISLINPNGASVAAPSQITVTIVDNETAMASNPSDVAAFLVSQHYRDFLNRQPDPAGLAFWINEIASCGSDVGCLEVKRINVSASFFLSIEFQQTGYLVERFYKVSYGDATGTSTFGSTHQLSVPVVRFNEFLQDTQRIGQGVVVLAPGWEQALESNKQAYALEFVQTTRFMTVFQTSMTPVEFVDRLNQNAGNVLSPGERTAAINLFSGAANTSNLTARAQAVRLVAEDDDLYNAENNRAFVLAQYFGYLRRNPNDPQDTDYTGYDFWLTKLNQFNGNYIDAEMVKAFLSSIEYRQRFGP